MQTILKQHWHNLPAEEAVRLLDSSDSAGLLLFEARRRLERFGANEIVNQKQDSALTQVLSQFNEPLISKALLVRTVLVSFIMVAGGTALFVWLLKIGEPVEEARTAVVNLIIMVQVFYLFNCRSQRKSPFELGFFSNGWLILGVLSMLGLQLLFTYHPAMENFFHTRAFGWKIWSYILGLSLATYLAIDILKRFEKNRE